MSGMPDQLLAEYEAAARRIAALHGRRERMAQSDPLERGQGAWHMGQGPLDPGDQARKLWDEYIEKRNAFLAAVGRPKQQDHRPLIKRLRVVACYSVRCLQDW